MAVWTELFFSKVFNEMERDRGLPPVLLILKS